MRMLVDYRPALRHRTGVGEYVHQMIAAVGAQLPSGDSLTVFSSSWRDRLDLSPAPRVAAVDRRVPVRLLNLLWHRAEWPPIEALAGTFDIVQAAHPLLIPARRAAQAVLIHDLDFLDHPERTVAEIRRDYRALAPAHARRADLVVTVSTYTARRILDELDVPEHRIAICPPGAPGWARRELSSDTSGPILFIGTIEPRKNLPVLFRAYARLVERSLDAPRLLLAGRTSPQSASILAELDRLPGIPGRVRHLGYVDDQERQRLYREASMLILPSRDEGFGIPALEAMTVGVPVIASNRGALPEVVGDAGTLVDADDEEGFARAMETVLHDASRRHTQVDAGFRRAREFSWRASASRLLTAYRETVDRRSREST